MEGYDKIDNDANQQDYRIEISEDGKFVATFDTGKND
jgi:hypothetical protein